MINMNTIFKKALLVLVKILLAKNLTVKVKHNYFKYYNYTNTVYWVWVVSKCRGKKKVLIKKN